jgi:hypothetical protein
MKYNLAKNSQVVSNIDVGNVALSSPQILPIIGTTSATYPTLSGIDVLCLDCDLGARVQIDELRYYFSSVSTSGTVGDGVKFYYKNEDFDVFISLETFVGQSYYYTTITSGTSAPRYIRIEHTVSGTGVSGTVNGFEVFNDDNVVDFGEDGTDELENFTLALEYGVEDIREINIYNDSDIKSDAYVIIEPQGTIIDELLSISNSQDGPWYGVMQSDNVVSAIDSLSQNWWNAGNYDGTKEVAGTLILTTESGATGVGEYTTRIFDTLTTQTFTYLNLDKTYLETGMIVATNDDDTQETIEIRSSNTKPKDYITYRRFLFDDGDEQIKYRDYWMYDDSIKFTSSPISDQGSYVAIDTVDDLRGRFYIDKITRKTAALYRYQANYYGNRTVLVRIDKNGVLEEQCVLAPALTDINLYSLIMDKNEGIWFYIYCGATTGTFFDQANSYYLAYFDSDMVEQFKLVNDSAFMFDMEVDYNTGELWYTNIENNRLVKLDITGEIIFEVTFTSYVRGLSVTEDGSCWVIHGSYISKISSTGATLVFINLTDVVTSMLRIAADGDDALWIIDGLFIRRIFLDGQIDFSVDLGYQGTEIQAYESGAAIFCVDRSWRFVSRDHRRVLRVIENDDGKNMYIGVEGVEYDSLIYGPEFPIPSDPVWSNMEWSTVPVNDYLMPADKYIQMKLTLRTNNILTSPVVNGIYLNESVQITDIFPHNYKPIYMKANVGGREESDFGSYNSNLRTWWYIST